MNPIETKDAKGRYNGFVIPLWHVDQGPPIEQVYVTSVAPNRIKGPHLHNVRRGLFYLVSGTGSIVIKASDGWDKEIACWHVGSHIRRNPPIRHGDYFEYRQPFGLIVPPRFPAALYNTGTVDAVFLNMPSPPWRKDEPDEHPVEGWDFKL